MSTTIQLDLPGQAHVADGPIDHSGMYVMHFAFRRDLDDLVAAVEATPLDDTTSWNALSWYWRFFGDVLHHHHSAEDDHYWPALATAVDRRGTTADRSIVAAMADEHAEIGGLLRECRRGVREVLVRPGASTATELHAHLVELRCVVDRHMTHEESETLPLVSRVVTTEEYSLVEAGIGRAYPLRLVSRLLPWAMHGLPGSAQQHMLATLGAPERALLRLGHGRFERRHQSAFRWVAR